MISRLKGGGGLIVTYRCTASCAHCLYKSSPRRDPSYMEEGLLRALLRKAASLGCRSFHIGGGEPFLDPDALVRVIRVTREEGGTIDYLETNAFWYRDPDSAAALLERIQEAGCRTLMVSLCPFHIPHVPLRKVEGAIAAAARVGMDYFLWQEQYYPELSALDKDKTHSLEELSERFGTDYVARAAARFGLYLNGRALETLKPYLKLRPVREIVAEGAGDGGGWSGGRGTRGCVELTRTSHFHLDLYGNYVPPGCVGLALDHRLLGRELPEEYRVLRLLIERGIGGLLEFAAEEYGFTPDPAGYVTKCHLCHEIRKRLALRSRLDEGPSAAIRGGPGEGGNPPAPVRSTLVRFPELAPLEFYDKD